MNELQVFNNKDFGGFRAVLIDGMPWVVGKDVAQILGYSNPNEAIADHVDEEDKLNSKSLKSLGQRGGWLINESGLYSLIMGSKLPRSREFKHWVTSEVLPAIRKTGAYVAGGDGDAAAIARAVAAQMLEAFAAQVPVIVAETVKAVRQVSGPVEQSVEESVEVEVKGCLEGESLGPGELECPYFYKVETFPLEIRAMVDNLLREMKAEGRFNYSRVARLCTARGYSISSPAVKKYCVKRFW